MGGGGSHGPSTTQTTTQVQVPPEVQQLQQFVLPNIEQAYSQMPLSAFTGAAPSAVEPLLGGQLQDISQIQGMAGAPLLSSPEEQALATYQSFMGTPAGASQATQQAEQALENQYNRYTLPALENQAALAGLGKSGALTDAIAAARSGVSAAEVPLLQQDLQNQLFGAQGALGIGQLMEQRPTQRAQTAFDALEQQRLNLQAPLQEQLQNYLRQQDIASGIAGAVTGIVPSTLSTQGYTTQRLSGGGGGGGGKGMPIGLSMSL